MRRPHAFAIALVALAVSVLVGMAPALSQFVNPPSPIPHDASVIAQGVVALPADDLAWRVTYATVPPAAPLPARSLPGFILDDEGVLLVSDAASRAKLRLASGEAAFAPIGARIQETPLTDPLAYYRIDLVPPDQAADPGNDAMVFVGQAFTSPGNERDIDLVRDVLDPDESVDLALDNQAAPVLLLVTAGQLDLVPASNPSANPVPLPAGQGVVLKGAVSAHASAADGATFVMAIIGPEPKPEATPTPVPTATPVPALASLTVQTLACPAGYDGDQYANDCSEPIAGVAFSIAGQSTGTAFDGSTGADGVAAFADLAPDTYVISGGPPDEYAQQVVACDTASATADNSGATVSLDAGTSAYCAWYAIPGSSQTEGAGSVTVSVHYCPGTPVDPYTDCTSGDPSGAVVYGPVVGTTDASGQVSGLPFGDYVLQVGAIGAPQGYQMSEVRGSSGGSSDGWAFTLDEANPDAALQIIYVPAAGAQGANGGNTTDNANDNARPDSDGDGLPDRLEARIGTDPANPDTDGDGISDGAELNAGTNPRVSNADTDGDGFTDGQELAAGSDPANPASVPGRPAAPAPANGAAPAAGDNADADQDGLPDSREAELGTDPNNADTDGDGLSDGAEVGLGAGAATGTDATAWDTDGDGVGDGDEISRRHRPARPGQ